MSESRTRTVGTEHGHHVFLTPAATVAISTRAATAPVSRLVLSGRFWLVAARLEIDAAFDADTLAFNRASSPRPGGGGATAGLGPAGALGGGAAAGCGALFASAVPSVGTSLHRRRCVPLTMVAPSQGSRPSVPSQLYAIMPQDFI